MLFYCYSATVLIFLAISNMLYSKGCQEARE
jgi:hypothetical protein